MMTVRSGSASLQARLQLHAVHARHFDVEQRDVELRLLDGLQRLARAGHRPRRVAFAGEPLAQRIAHHQSRRPRSGFCPWFSIATGVFHCGCHVVLPFLRAGRAPGTACACQNRLRPPAAGSPAAPPRIPFLRPAWSCTAISPPCCSTMLCATARPRPVRFWSSLVVKNGSKMCGSTSAGMPHPGVRHPHPSTVRPRRPAPWPLPAAALRHGFGGVHQQHQHHLLDLVGVAIHRRQIRPPDGSRSSMFCMSSLCFTSSTARRTIGVQVVGLAVAGRLPREGQQVLHQVAAALAFALDGLQAARPSRRASGMSCFSTRVSTSRA